MTKVLKVEKGNGGWGGPLYLKCDGKKNKVLSMTGGGIHDLSSYIAESIDGEAVDGFKDSPADDEVVCAVINCGGTLRCGIYPQKGLYTINLNAIGPAGPLAEHIVPELYVSGARERNIKEVDETELGDKKTAVISSEEKIERGDETQRVEEKTQENEKKGNPVFSFMTSMGS